MSYATIAPEMARQKLKGELAKKRASENRAKNHLKGSAMAKTQRNRQTNKSVVNEYKGWIEEF